MERGLSNFEKPSYERLVHTKQAKDQETYQILRDFLSTYQDPSILEKQGDMFQFLYYNAPQHFSRKEYNPKSFFNALKPKIQDISNDIPNPVNDSKYYAVGLYANRTDHDALYKRTAYLQPQWEYNGVLTNTFNITPVNIYGEERKVGEFALGLIYRSPESNEVEHIISLLNKTNKNISAYPVVREVMGKKYNATEIVFTHFNKSKKTADLAPYYNSLFQTYRILAKQLITSIEGNVPYNLTQFNGDSLEIEKSHQNYFVPPVLSHRIPDLISKDNSEHKYRPTSKIIPTAVENNPLNEKLEENTSEKGTNKTAKKEEVFNQ